MKWHLECAFHLTPETLMSCSCALQSRLIQGMLMMRSTWEGDSFRRCVCVRKENGGITCFFVFADCMSVSLFFFSFFFFCNTAKWCSIGFDRISISFPACFNVWTGNSVCLHLFEVNMEHIMESLQSSSHIVIVVCPVDQRVTILSCPHLDKRFVCEKSDMSRGVIRETDQYKKTHLWLHRA